MPRLKFLVLAMAVLLAVAPGCSHRRALHSTKERKLTLGLVQKHVQVGVAQADVAATLGSPNIVTRTNGKESWIYDKVATEKTYSESSGTVGGGVAAGGVAGDVPIGGGVGGSYGRKKGASATTQRTLTVVIRFDANNCVESFSYHTSSF